MAQICSEGYLELKKTTPFRQGECEALDRPRERLLSLGARALADVELLALCLGSGCRGESASAMAQRLLLEFDGMAGLLGASIQRLQATKGLGTAQAARIKAIAELYVRQTEVELSDRNMAQTMSQSTQVMRYVQQQIAYEEREVFACLYLDTRHRLLRFEEVFRGTVNRAYVFPREILRRALMLNAVAVVLAHNHPSGVVEPSQADIHVTEDLVDLLKRVEVRVLDHIIVAPGQALSMAAGY